MRGSAPTRSRQLACSRKQCAKAGRHGGGCNCDSQEGYAWRHACLAHRTDRREATAARIALTLTMRSARSLPPVPQPCILRRATSCSRRAPARAGEELRRCVGPSWMSRSARSLDHCGEKPREQAPRRAWQGPPQDEIADLMLRRLRKLQYYRLVKPTPSRPAHVPPPSPRSVWSAPGGNWWS